MLAHECPTEVPSSVTMLDVAQMDAIPSHAPVDRNTSLDPEVLVDVFVNPRNEQLNARAVFSNSQTS